jgi:hypothetical protein
MRHPRILPIIACLAGPSTLVLPACSTSPPLAPSRPVSLLVEYTQPIIPNPDPPLLDLAMCFHHYAPANLSVATSWGAQGRLVQAGADPSAFAALFQDIPVNDRQWLAIYDIEFCKEGRPLVSRGVRANGIELRSVVETSTGLLALEFSISTTGVVTP